VGTLLVTGASGFLGAELCLRAAAAGWDVVGTYLTRTPGRVDATRLDVRDAGAVASVVAGARPAAVVHTAYRQEGDAAAAVNVDGAAHVASAARAAGARLVHLSTDVVFGGDRGRPLREDDPPDPMTAYGETKARAEAAVGREHPDAVLVRTSLLYRGPGRELSKHEQLAVEAARGERDVRFFDDEVRSPAQVGDVAAAILELIDVDVRGPLHVAGADPLTRLEFARLAAAAHGEDPARLAAGSRPAGRPGDCALDCSRAAALLRTRLRGAREVLGG